MLVDATMIENNVLQFSNCVKYLGVYIDNELKFHNQIDSVSAKCYLIFSYLYQFMSYLESNLKWKLCNVLLLSIRDYCSTVYYRFLSLEYRNKLQILQNSCLKNEEK